MDLAKYIVKRVLYGVLTLFIVATATFFLMRLIPGGPFLGEKAPSPQTLKYMQAKYGLDKPLLEQYTTYMGGVLKGDFGPSLKQRGRTVAGIIELKFPVSARLGVMAIAVALFVGVPLGCWAALRRGKLPDRVISVFCAAGVSIPSFVTCTAMMYIFGVLLGWLPTLGLNSPQSYIMPVFALALLPTAYVARLTRSTMLDVMGQDYMRTAKAKGVPQVKRVFKHALRNGILPTISYLGPMLAFLVTGSMVVEKLLTIPGLGGEFISSILNRDYPMVMGTTIFLAALLIGINIIVDIIYKLVDPRIKFE